MAWDCATGNGQAARILAGHFKKVMATDISQKQLDHAYQAENIFYSLSPAEKTSFADNAFDLITVAQALHWFDRDKFCNEVKRVTKPGGILAVWGYNLLTVSPKIDKLVRSFYTGVVGPYWDEARKLVEQEYRTINFPFREIQVPAFHYNTWWTIQHLEGYLNTWSATQQYIKRKEVNPVSSFIKQVAPYWNTKKEISFPIFLRTFVVDK